MSHPGNDLTPSTSHRSGFHLLGNILGVWSSDLNRAVVEELDPQPGHMLLDIGAGLGPATIKAAKRVTPGGRVIAVEPSLFMRSVLRLRSSWQRSRRAVDICVGSAENLPVADRSIDAAWAVNAVHHF